MERLEVLLREGDRTATNKPDEIELDEVIYADIRCRSRICTWRTKSKIFHTGSKSRLLDRLLAFKVNIENKLKLSIANKLFKACTEFKEQQRKPMTLGQPKLPPMKDQEVRFATHIPYAPWCQACVAGKGTRSTGGRT